MLSWCGLKSLVTPYLGNEVINKWCNKLHIYSASLMHLYQDVTTDILLILNCNLYWSLTIASKIEILGVLNQIQFQEKSKDKCRHLVISGYEDLPADVYILTKSMVWMSVRSSLSSPSFISNSKSRISVPAGSFSTAILFVYSLTAIFGYCQHRSSQSDTNTSPCTRCLGSKSITSTWNLRFAGALYFHFLVRNGRIYFVSKQIINKDSVLTYSRLGKRPTAHYQQGHRFQDNRQCFDDENRGIFDAILKIELTTQWEWRGSGSYSELVNLLFSFFNFLFAAGLKTLCKH